MKELLTEGQGAPALGESHEENAGLPFLGSGSEAGKAALAKFEAAGRVEESKAEMGGGGDPIDDWVVKKGGYDGLVRQIQQNGWADNMVWPLGDGTKLSVAEVKRRAATASSPPPPEQQPAPRSVDWRDSLPQDQRKRLEGFENRIIGFSDQELQLVESGIRETRAKALKDGWNHRSVQEGDADMCLRAIQEKLVGQNDLESILIENGLFNHVKLVQQREGLKDLQDTLMYLAGKLGHHDSLLENPPSDLFPSAAKLPNGEWDATGEKLAQFLRKLTTGNKPNNGG